MAEQKPKRSRLGLIVGTLLIGGALVWALYADLERYGDPVGGVTASEGGPAKKADRLAADSPPSPSANSAGATEAKRKMYALAEVGPKYCPNIETQWFAKGSIGYRMTEEDYPLYKAAEDHWYEVFRQVGSRAVVCEMLMREHGPGGKLELFQFK